MGKPAWVNASKTSHTTAGLLPGGNKGFKAPLQLLPGLSQPLPGGAPAAAQPKKVIRRWLLRLVGTGLFLGLLWRLNLNWGQVIADVSQANLLAVLGATGLIFPIIGLKAWRWRSILNNYKIKLPMRQAAALYGLGLSAGSITPGQAGDVIKAFSLQEQGYSPGKSLGSVLLDRLFDVLILVLLAMFGLLQLGKNFTGQLPAMLGLLALVGGGIIILVVPRFANFFLEAVPGRLLQRKLNGGQAVAEGHPHDGYHPGLADISGPILLTLVTAGLAIGRTWLLALAIGVNLDPAAALTVSSLATVASLVPLTVGGIGTRDLALISVMGQLGYNNEMAVSLSTLLLLLNLFNLFAGFISWFIFKPVHPRQERTNSPVSKAD